MFIDYYFIRMPYFWIIFLYLLVPVVICKQPNILFIIVDDLRPAIGAYGDKNAYTPNINKLAEKSFVFTNAYAQQALCAPSRNSLLTSRRPDTLHLYDFYSYWRQAVGNFTTIPQHFKNNGYFTQSIGKVFHPGISSNFTDDAEYSWSGVPFHPKTEQYKEAKVCLNNDGSLERNLLCPVLVKAQPGGTLPDLESTAVAIEFLKRWKTNGENQPFFLAVGLHKPHIPFKFPVEYLDLHPMDNITLPNNRWRPSSLPTVAWNPWLDVKDREDIKKLNIEFPFGVMPDDYTKKIIQHYNAAITYIDDLIGQILANVDKNTLIVLTSDHGWSMGEHGEFSKFSNFDVATHVPLIIHVPNLNNKEIINNELVELVDLFPTLVDLTQISSPLKKCNTTNSILCTEGQSLVPLMYKNVMGKAVQGKSAVFFQYPRPGAYPTVKPNSDKPHLNDINIMGYSVKTKQYRYTEWVAFNHSTFKPNWKINFGRELYDHLLDPGENLNLVDRPQLSYIVDNLRKMLILGWKSI